MQIWVPDVRGDDFAAEAQRQAKAVARAAAKSDDQDFVEAISAPWDE